MEFPKLVSASDTEGLRQIGCFLKSSTLYSYKHQGQYPGLFVKVGRKLFIKTDEWFKILQKDFERQGVDFDEMFEGLKVLDDEK